MSVANAMLLRTIPLFAELSEEECKELAGLLVPRSYRANEPIFWIGDRGADFHVVQQGRVVLSVPNQEGGETQLAVLGPGQFFGEVSLLDGGARTASARAQTDVTLLSLEREAFLSFLRRTPSAAVQLVSVLGQRTRRTLDMLRGIKNVNQEAESQVGPLQRIVDRAARVGASGWFLMCNMLFIATWIAHHTLRHDRPISFHDDPPTFFGLGILITIEAILLTMFVLNSQRRQAERDRIRADLDYQVNLKAHLEVMELHRKVDKLAAMLEQRGDSGNGPVRAVTDADKSSTSTMVD